MRNVVHYLELRQALAAAKLALVSITLKHVAAFNCRITWNTMPSASLAWCLASTFFPMVSAIPLAFIAPLNVTSVGV
jgi:hypothetical protein